MPTLPKRSDDTPPTLPYDLGDLSESRLMELFNQFTQWANTVDTQVTEADVEEEEAEEELSLAESSFMIQAMEGRGIGVQQARLLRDADEDILTHRRTLRLARAKRKRLSTLLRGHERSAQLLSRELTRRTSLAPKSGRFGP